jgi:hypothetical protein
METDQPVGTTQPEETSLQHAPGQDQTLQGQVSEMETPLEEPPIEPPREEDQPQERTSPSDAQDIINPPEQGL